MTASIELPRTRLRFPDACAECDAAAGRSYPLRLAKNVALSVPLCSHCHERKTLGQSLSAVGIAVLGLAITIAYGAAADALMTGAMDHATQVKLAIPMALALLAFPIIGIVIGVRFARNGYHRRRSAVFLDRYDAATDRVTIGVRRPELAKAISSLGGEGAGDYRAGAQPLRAAPPRKPGLPYWATLVIGVAIIGIGWIRYDEIRGYERAGESFSITNVEHLLYLMGGAPAVLALFVGVGLLLLVGSTMQLIGDRRRRAANA